MPSEPGQGANLSPLDAGAGSAPDARALPSRELSWLEFNQRVLDDAADPTLPLAERLRFLGLSASNVDELFAVRVAALKSSIEAGVPRRSPDGTPPREQLAAVSARVHRMVADQYALWREQLRPALERDHGLRILRPSALAPAQAEEAHRRYRERVFPLLTPLAHDRSHPFPRLRSGSISLAVQLPRPPGRRRGARDPLVIVGVPTASVPRLVPVSPDGACVLVEDLVAEHVGELFSTAARLRTAAFRVTRGRAAEADGEEGDAVRAPESGSVRRRHLGAAVRLEVAAGAPSAITDSLARQLGLGEPDVYAVDGPLQLQDLAQLAADLAPRAARRPEPPPVALPQAGTGS